MENHAKKRSSINDMTLADVNDADDVPAPRSDSEATMDPAHFGQQTPQFQLSLVPRRGFGHYMMIYKDDDESFS